MTKNNSTPKRVELAHAGSFRDPAGFIFRNQKGVLFRAVTQTGAKDFDLLMQSGLYGALVDNQWLVSHTRTKTLPVIAKDAHVVIKPETIPHISYPFEWSFSQLKDAALLTLRIQKKALEYGMSLKDASAYNIQFYKGRPIFIDTLSFEKYEPSSPWQAYRQFCQHFLAPLVLMAHVDTNFSQLSRVHLDGIPLELASRLLPRRKKFRPGIAMHIVMHARAQKAKATEHKQATAKISMNSLLGILESLKLNIRRLKPRQDATEWGDYYDKTNYTASAADQKAKLLKSFVRPLKAATALDLGGNNGRYSRVLNGIGVETICSDIDPNAVEANYRYVETHHEKAMLPLLVDLTNPGGNLGWGNDEREPIHERLKCDVVLSLALIHHLAISNNLPFGQIADYFSRFAPYLVIEFVPKADSQVQKLLSTRKDIFPDYHEEGFEGAFKAYYRLVRSDKIPGTKRRLYLFKKR